MTTSWYIIYVSLANFTISITQALDILLFTFLQYLDLPEMDLDPKSHGVSQANESSISEHGPSFRLQ